MGAVILASCARTEAGSERPVTAPLAPTLVPVAKATRADLSNTLTLTAEFEPFQQVDVMAKVSGYVRSIKVDLGDRVGEGQLLATLEIPEMEDDISRSAAAVDQADAEIATATDELKRAETAHELAHLSYSRIADVLKREPGLVPQQEVDEAHSRDLVSEAQVLEAKSVLKTSEMKAGAGTRLGRKRAAGVGRVRVERLVGSKGSGGWGSRRLLTTWLAVGKRHPARG